MRPIVLDMNGFACFREAAHVDFAGADFFVLVGPTGSGKSTVIDAMTFALFGSVPRWGRRGMVSLALAPTVARGTVKLVFEVEGHRYVVARELRRLGGQVSQRAASLERLEDPQGLALPGEPTEILAKDLAGVTDTVERLLGLSYDDFCQCVVLPQGQFANFLHSRPADRQEILLRLLGAEHYRQMMMRANQGAGNAAQRAAAIAEMLTGFADATQDAEDAARATEETLIALKGAVQAAVPRVLTAEQELAAAAAQLVRVEQERAALAGVRVPDDVAKLDADLKTVRDELDHARAAERLAEEADSAARHALGTGPQRGPLELVRQRRAELTDQTMRIPSVHADVTRLSNEAASAKADETEAEAALEDYRAQQDVASRHREVAEQRVKDVAAKHVALAAVTVPSGTDQLDERHQASAQALREASAILQAAEQADSDARAARSSAIAPGLLEQARRDLIDLGRVIVDQADARAKLNEARTAKAAAESALQEAEATGQQRQHDLDSARRDNVVADLRPHLLPGHACPVCEQTVGTLPPALEARAIDNALARLDEAMSAVAVSRTLASTAAAAENTAAARLNSLAKDRARLLTSFTTAVAGPLASPLLTAVMGILVEASPAQVDAAPAAADVGAEELSSRVSEALAEVVARLHQREALDRAADTAAAAVDSARAETRSAQEQLDQAAADIATARKALSAARDPLVGLGAPPADHVSLVAAWTDLASWAAAQADIQARNLARAREDEGTAAIQLARVQEEFARAETALAESRATATAVARAEQEAQTRLAELTERIEALRQLLAGVPDERQVGEQLELLNKLESAVKDAELTLLAARSRRADAEHGLSELERAASAAQAQLSSARDPLVALGAPAIDTQGAGLLASWEELAGWAAALASAREQAMISAGEALNELRTKVAQLTDRLSADLGTHGIDIAPEAVAGGAAPAVAEALERARAARTRIVERRHQAADLIARRDAELDQHRVAKMLGDLLRSDNFPRWLVTAAVDVLVAEASQILAGLSNEQYDLTHEDGDFYIIDHTDADSRRSVRTLSGGETFQASLALALALSSQMTALAAAGAARLDSIFLDEGFGTLDPETLDVVATTLESLAQGERMVGIITHVTALAERVPVRYAVSRNARTSTIVREGFAAPDAA